MSAEKGSGIEMHMAKYLLSIEEFMEKDKEKVLLERAFSCVDETRRRRVQEMRPGRARAACLGAGLLLQLAVGEAMGKKTGESIIKQYSASRLLACAENMPRFAFNYSYGEKGKPYLKDFPFYFNLSHSGGYVLCGLGLEEIGADIQQHCGKDVRKLARRFFSGREAAAIERAGEAQEKLFYRLWARKEAYGKLTGKGIAEALDVDLLLREGRLLGEKGEPEDESWVPSQKAVLRVGRAVPSQQTVLPDGRRLLWEEYDAEGYSIAFCRYG